MSTTSPVRQAAGAQAPQYVVPARLRHLPLVAPFLGVLTVGLLLFHGLVLDTQLPIPSLVWTLAPAFVLALLVGSPPLAQAGRHGLLAAPPLALGLVTATTVVGTVALDVPLWWIGGAALSGLPFLLAAYSARLARSA